MEKVYLKNVIFEAASKAAYDAVVKVIKNALTLHRCTQIKVSGAVTEGNGFSSLGFGDIKFEFLYYSFPCVIQLSPSGGQFYATVKSHHETIMKDETCLSVDSFVNKLDKKLKKK